MMNRPDRASLARETIHKIVPELLKTDNRASNGIKNTCIVAYDPNDDPPTTSSEDAEMPASSSPSTPQKFFPIFNMMKSPKAADTSSPMNASTSGSRAAVQSDLKMIPKIKVVKSDSWNAAFQILNRALLLDPHIAVLNMASAKTPGGGVLTGAVAQEESLCIRSTLHASLTQNPNWYRLPELSGIFSPDVKVIRATESPWPMLPVHEQYYASVISVAAVKNPEVRKNKEGKWVYQHLGDKEVMVKKIRLIFQIAKKNKVTHLVLGALGCGVYHHPPEEVAKLFKRVLLGEQTRGPLTTKDTGIKEVVFAIFDEGANLRSFREVLGSLN